MINVIFFVFVGFLCGVLSFSGYNYFWRRRREGQAAEFRWADLLALLLSLVIDFAFSPLLNVPGAVSVVLRGLGSGYVFLSSLGFAFAVNFLVLKPLEYLDHVSKVTAGRGHTGFQGFVQRRMAVLSEVPKPVSKKTKRFWLVALTLALVVVPGGFVYAAMQYTVTISSHGTVKAIGFGFYSDAACTSSVSDIDWGTVEPGHQYNHTYYLKNTVGNAAVTASLAVGNFNPAAGSAYLALTWNYSGSTLSPGQVVPVVLTLSVADTITGIAAFNFEISVMAKG
jgi:hypothetical protein